MKVKIGDKTYDPNDQPIAVFLAGKDKENIANMPKESNMYCSCHESISTEQIREWLKDELGEFKSELRDIT